MLDSSVDTASGARNSKLIGAESTDSPVAKSVFGLRSKLSAISTLSDVLSKASNLTPEQVGRLKMIGDNADYVANGLKGYSSSSKAGYAPVSGVRLVDVCELVAQAVRATVPIFDFRSQKLTIRYSEQCLARVDYDLTLESIRSLLTTLSENSDAGSLTRVSVGIESDEVYVKVERVRLMSIDDESDEPGGDPSQGKSELSSSQVGSAPETGFTEEISNDSDSTYVFRVPAA